MKISVLINNYNYAQFLEECIESALSQDYPDFEVVVVDDGSSDGSREIIAGYEGRIVPVLKLNGGQASSFNAGFEASSGDLIFLLDADDTFLPGKLKTVAAIYLRERLDWCFDKVTNDRLATLPSDIHMSRIEKVGILRRRGFPSLPVPTSGLTFTRKLVAENHILPMPIAQDVVLSDNFLKFAASCHGDGAIVETPLTFQRIHGTNRYTSADRSEKLRSRIMIQTGLELARLYPKLKTKGLIEIAGGLCKGGRSAAEIWKEIRRCTESGTFGATGALKMISLVAIKKNPCKNGLIHFCPNMELTQSPVQTLFAIRNRRSWWQFSRIDGPMACLNCLRP